MSRLGLGLGLGLGLLTGRHMQFQQYVRGLIRDVTFLRKWAKKELKNRLSTLFSPHVQCTWQ